MTSAGLLDVGREWARFQEALRDPDRAQDQLVREITSTHAGTRYGRQWGFAGVRTLADYRRAVPIVTLDELAPHIAEASAGVPDVLVAGAVEFLAQTSGTSGAPKYLPFGRDVVTELVRFAGTVLGAMEHDHPGSSTRTLTIFGRYDEARSPSGITIGSASGFARYSLREHPYFGLVPHEVWELADFEARYYAILRIALESPLRQIATFNPSTILTLFAKAFEHADALAADLERAARPEIARRLRDSVRAGRFAPRVVWPDLDLMMVWKGGMCSLYLPDLEASCPGAVIRPMATAATEGAMFIPLADDWSGGVPALTTTVLELVPEDGGSNAEPVPFRDVHDGSGYRAVMTNHRGLYRVLMDDVFHVEGWHGELPIMRFSHRHGATSSLSGEKLSEDQVVLALASAVRASGVNVVDAQLAPEWGSPPRYVLIVEAAHDPSSAALSALLATFDDVLAGANMEYAAKREAAQLGAPELVVAPRDTFLRMRKRLAAGRSDAQVKVAKLRRDLLDRSELEIERVIPWSKRA